MVPTVASRRLMDDYTPPVVALQGVMAMKELFCLDPESILDPSAGAGVFGQAFRTVWPNAHTSAIEPKAVESWFLRQNYDQHVIGEFGPTLVGEGYDLVLTNPPFHSWREFVEKSLMVVRPGGYVVFLGLTSWNGRSEAGYELFETIPPVAEMRIPGAVGYRIKGNDVRDYCYWVFRRSRGEAPLPCWVSFNLPRLPGNLRKWHERKKPGRCSHGQELQKSSSQYILSALRERCLPRGLFVPTGSDSRPKETVER